jgi:hypothetical protein
MNEECLRIAAVVTLFVFTRTTSLSFSVSERSPVTETVCSPVVELKESRDLQEVRGEEV